VQYGHVRYVYPEMLRGNRLHYRCSHCLGTLYGRLRLRPLRFYSFIKTPKVNAPDCTAMCMLCLVNRVQLALNPLNDWIYGNSVQKLSKIFPCEVLNAVLAISAIHLRFTSSLFCHSEIVLSQHAAYAQHDQFRNLLSVTTAPAVQRTA
jgi:hypothetical protein